MWWWWVREYFGHTFDERLCDFFGFWSSEESQKSLALLLLHAAAIFFLSVCFGPTCRRETTSLMTPIRVAPVLTPPTARWCCSCMQRKQRTISTSSVGLFSCQDLCGYFFNFSILDSPYTARNSSPQTQSSQDALTLMHLFCFIFFDYSGRGAVSQAHLVHITKQKYIESEMRLFFWQSPDEQGFCATANHYDRYMKNVTFLLTCLPSINSVPLFENHVLCSHGVTVVGLMSFSFFSSSSCLLLQVTLRL